MTVHYKPKRYRIIDGKRQIIPLRKTACGEREDVVDEVTDVFDDMTCPWCRAVYAPPPRQEVLPLTDEDREELFR